MIDLLLRQAPEFFTASNLAFLARAAGMTLVLTAFGGGIGALCGFAIVVVRTSVSPWLFPVRMLAIAFVELFRRIPFLVVLFLVLFSIQALSPNASLFTIATIAICLVSTAFISEIIRAGFDAIPRQQIEAAATMNVPRWRVVHAIILPQAWTLVVPPAIAFLVMFIKDTALASQMGVVELTFVGKTLANRGFSSFLVFGTVMAIYFAISWPVAAFGRFLEARLPLLAIEGLSASYGKLPVLRDVSLTVDAGSVVALIGPSGSGKSTLLRALVGLTRPNAGVVQLGNEVIHYGSASSLRAARRRMAIVFQQYNLFQNMTVLRNVTMAPIMVQGRPRPAVEDEARLILAKVGLAEKHAAYPDQLSGGQQQRVAIARALMLHPDLLLLDEVTAALDPELVNEVLDTIRFLAAGGMTMILVSHEMSFVRDVADIVVMMDGGQIVEQGPPETLFDRPQTVRAGAFMSKIRRV